MKKLLCLILSLILIITSYGCDYKDIDRRIFIVAIGVDFVDGNGDLKITLKGAIPPNSKVNHTEKNHILIEVEAASIGEGLRKVKQKLSLEPDYSHMKILVLGRNFVNESKDLIRHITSFFITRRDFQNLMLITIANPSAKEILKSEASTENYAGADLFLRFGQGVDSPYSYRKKLSDLYTQLNTPGLTSVIPILEIDDKIIKANDLAILSKHARIATTIKDEDVKVFNILANKRPKSAFIYAHTPDDKTLGFNLKGSKTKYRFKKDGELLVCNVDIKLNLLAEEGTEYNIDRSEVIAIIENQIKCKVSSLMDKFKTENVDPLNLQLNYWQYTPSYDLSDDWIYKIIPKMQYKITVKAKFEGKNVAR